MQGLALIGGGSFAQKQYLPILSTKLADLVKLKAIWSRSKESAEASVSLVKDQIPQLQAKWGEDGFQDILHDKSIHGVLVALAPQVQFEYVSRALHAGKHVLQEKPVALSTSDAQNHLLLYNEIPVPRPLWAIAENYRFEPGLFEAAKLAKEIGELTTVEVLVESPMNSGRASFFSAWRRDLKGGYILDGAVHFVAALRLITGCEVKNVYAITRHVDPLLPAPDNVSALMELETGCPVVFVLSFSCSTKKMSWRVVGSRGTVEVEQCTKADQQGFKVTHHSVNQEPAEVFYPNGGVEEELRAFIKDMEMGGNKPDRRASVSEAFQDIAVVETILNSNNRVVSMSDYKNITT